MANVPDYAWRCVVCEQTNAARSPTCAGCGVPACATGREILRAKLAFERSPGRRAAVEAGLPGRTTGPQAHAAFAALTMEQKVVATIGYAVAAGGGLAMQFGMSWTALASGALALAIGMGVVALARRL